MEIFVFGDEYVVGLEIGMSERWASQGGIAVWYDIGYSLQVFFEILYMLRGRYFLIVVELSVQTLERKKGSAVFVQIRHFLFGSSGENFCGICDFGDCQ